MPKTPETSVKTTAPAVLRPDNVRPVKVGEAEVAMFWMVLTAPEETEKLVELNEATPLTAVVASMPATVRVPPSDTGDPDTETPVPAVAETVILELARSPLATEPSTIEAELTDGVEIKPALETVNFWTPAAEAVNKS